MASRRTSRRKLIITSGGVGVLLAIVIAVVGWGESILGPELSVQKPTGVYFYREGRNKATAVIAVVPVQIENKSNYNEFIRSAHLNFRGIDARFTDGGLVRLDFIGEGESTALCAPQTVCVPHEQLAVTALPDAVIEIPARGNVVKSLSFRLICDEGRDCRRFGYSVETANALRGSGLDLEVELQFREDGHRVLTCSTGPVAARRLADDRGWLGLSCRQAGVEDSSSYWPF